MGSERLTNAESKNECLSTKLRATLLVLNEPLTLNWQGASRSPVSPSRGGASQSVIYRPSLKAPDA